MNALSRIFRTVRTARGSETGLASFYNAVAQRGAEGGPRYDELRRDYQQMNRINSKYGLY
jgi:hypothetical protein